jgi:hypothetical protein
MQQLPPFLESIQSRKECKNLDLESYLIKPMQRLTKYPLLIQVQPTPDTVVTTPTINGPLGVGGRHRTGSVEAHAADAPGL